MGEALGKNVLQVNLLIRSHLDQLKPAEKKVANYVLKKWEEVIHLSITKLAKEVGVSEATIVKFCQRIGYSGYQELKIMLAQLKQVEKNQERNIYDPINSEDNLEAIINKLFQTYKQSLENTKMLFTDDNLQNSINLVLNAKKIYFFGFGASGIVAQDAELKFKRIGYQAEALVDNHIQNTIAPLLNKNDLVVAISDSGKTKELFESLEVVIETEARIISITSNLGSPIPNLADEVLLTSSNETSFRGSAMSSRMAQLAIIDVLFVGAATAEYDKTIEALEKTRITLQKSKLH